MTKNWAFVMNETDRNRPKWGRVLLLLVLCLLWTGCRPFDHYDDPLGKSIAPEVEPPREKSMVSLPAYRIEPPDVISIELMKVVPKSPYYLQMNDVIFVQAPDVAFGWPALETYYRISPDGTIDLGIYGNMRIEGMTIDQARDLIKTRLAEKKGIWEHEQTIVATLIQATPMQPINGRYQVGPDGCVNLRFYGSVHVAGMTVMETKFALEEHLSHYLSQPMVAVDVIAFNSKKYYVITQGAGQGDNVRQLPITGNETVLDAISKIGGMSQLSSQEIWIARPAIGDYACEQRLPVDWQAISGGGSTATNYQLMPNDRVFIVQDNFTATSNWLGKVMAPFERAAGAISLGVSTSRNIRNIDSDYDGYGGRGYNGY